MVVYCNETDARYHFFLQILMTVLERHAMEEVNVKMVSMTIHANATADILAKTVKQVSNTHKPVSN